MREISYVTGIKTGHIERPPPAAIWIPPLLAKSNLASEGIFTSHALFDGNFIMLIYYELISCSGILCMCGYHQLGPVCTVN